MGFSIPDFKLAYRTVPDHILVRMYESVLIRPNVFGILRMNPVITPLDAQRLINPTLILVNVVVCQDGWFYNFGSTMPTISSGINTVTVSYSHTFSLILTCKACARLVNSQFHSPMEIKNRRTFSPCVRKYYVAGTLQFCKRDTDEVLTKLLTRVKPKFMSFVRTLKSSYVCANMLKYIRVEKKSLLYFGYLQVLEIYFQCDNGIAPSPVVFQSMFGR